MKNIFKALIADERAGIKFSHAIILLFAVLIAYSIYGMKTSGFGDNNN